MEPGTKIEFTKSVYQESSSEWPLQLLARKGDKGTVIEKSTWKPYEWKVQTEDKNPFYVMAHEFKPAY